MMFYQRFVYATDKIVFLVLNTCLCTSASVSEAYPSSSDQYCDEGPTVVTVYLSQLRWPSAHTARAVGRQPVPRKERW